MKDLDKIEELYETVKSDPNNFQAVRELSIALMDNGFNDEALKQLVYLVGIFPEDARLYFNIGFAFEKLKSFKKAEYSYRKAISLDKEEPDYVYNLGYLLLNQNKNIQEAIECFNKVLEKQPDDANTHFNLGILYFKEKKYELAIQYFQKAYDLNNFDTLALFYLGNSYHQMKDFDKAKEIYEKILESTPEYTWAYFNLAQIAWTNNDKNEAIKNLNKVIELNPRDIPAIKLLAQIYITSEDYETAHNIIKQAIKENPYCGDLYYFMAKTLPYDPILQIKYLKKALENYKNLSINPNQIKKEIKAMI